MKIRHASQLSLEIRVRRAIVPNQLKFNGTANRMTMARFKKFVAIAAAIGIAVAPLTPANAQQYYRVPLQGVDALPPPGETGEPFEVGTYAGPVAYDRNGSASVPAPSIAGGATPYYVTLASGVLPPGMSLSSAGAISGSPSTVGEYVATIRFRDGANREQLRGITISVLTPAGSPLTTAFSVAEYAATTNQAGSVPGPTTSGGTAPYSYSGGTAGATVDPVSGQVTFNFATPGTKVVPITAKDSLNRTASASVTIQVADPLAVASLGGPFYATVGQGGTIGTASATGGRGTPTFSAAPGSSLIAINGTTVEYSPPASAGTYTMAIRATDVDGRTATSPYFDIIAANAPSPGYQSTYSNGNAGQASSIPASSPSGGEGPYTLALTSNPGNVLAGTPQSGFSYNQPAGTYGPFTVTVTDARGRQGSQSFGITIPQSLHIGPYAATYSGTENVPGSIPLPTVSGGTAPYSYSLNGAPSGVAPTPEGVISYSAAAGTYAISMTVTDAHQRSVTSNTFTLTLGSAYQLTYSQPPQLFANVESQFTPTVAGGTGPYTYALTGGSIPSGMSFSTSTGIVSGFPNNNVAGSFTIEVTDAGRANAKVSRTVSYTIGTIDDTAIWNKVSGISHGGSLAQYQAGSAASKLGLSDSIYSAYSNPQGGGYGGIFYASNGGSTLNFTINFSSATALSGMIVRVSAASQNTTTAFPVAVYRNGTKIGNFTINAGAPGSGNVVQSFTIPLSGSFNTLQLSYELGVTPNGLIASFAEIDWIP